MRTLISYVGACVALGLFATAPNLQAIQKTRASLAVPAGTEIKVRLTTPLDTGETRAGQSFSGTTAESVTAGGKTLIPKGTTVTGKVVEAVSSGRLKRPASITLELNTVSTEPLKIDGKSHLVRNAALIGGGTAAGAIIGGATGGKKGAAIGAAIGAGAGTATAFVTGKNEIALPAEMVLPFVAGSGAIVVNASSMPAPTANGAADSSGTMQRAGEMVQVVFTSRDQELIRGYYGGGGGLPPGLAKRGGNLPPGLAKQLRKNGTLPPGLQKQVEPFPADLSRQLSPLPSGLSRVMVAGRAIIMDRNHRILDLIALVQ